MTHQPLTPTRTPIAHQWRINQATTLGRVQTALLGTINGRRNIIELESVARAMGLEPGALEDLRQQGLIVYSTPADTRPLRVDARSRPGVHTAPGITAVSP